MHSGHHVGSKESRAERWRLGARVDTRIAPDPVARVDIAKAHNHMYGILVSLKHGRELTNPGVRFVPFGILRVNLKQGVKKTDGDEK